MAQLNAAAAYRKGWAASARAVLMDLDSFDDKFRGRWGDEFLDDAERGWIDYASGYPFDPDKVHAAEREIERIKWVEAGCPLGPD